MCPTSALLCFLLLPFNYVFVFFLKKKKVTGSELFCFQERGSSMRKPHKNRALSKKFTLMSKNLNPSDCTYLQRTVPGLK